MTVAELIEELQKMPQHHPVRASSSNAVVGVRQINLMGSTGPVVIIDTQCDQYVNLSH